MASPRTRWSHMIFPALLLAVLAGSRITRAADPAAVVIVATADLKGKTSPCGCHVPKGGLSRLAATLDSVRAAGTATFFVDAGGLFADEVERPDLADFMLRSLVRLKVDALAVGPRDLRYGVSFLRETARAAGAPIVCANLLDRARRQPVFPASRIVERGGVTVGVFALVGERYDLGPAADSLVVEDPENAAHRVVSDLRARGAQIIVLLSQLGRVGGEDLVAAVPGIDVVMLGHDIPVLERGRRIGNAIAGYAGDQGQQVNVFSLTLGADRRYADGASHVVTLGPDVREHAATLESVKRFENEYNERMRAAQRRAQALADADPDQDPVDHFVGGAICARCHTAEAEQWRTTAHSLAWETLVREKKDATPECIPCHSVGYREPGGFRDAASTPHLVDVQCENCHGMGTLHTENWLARSAVGERTCRGCHNAERDPEFDFAKKFPLMVHSNRSGESIRIVKARRAAGYSPGER